MLGKIIVAILVLTMLTLSLFSIYQNVPRPAVELKAIQSASEPTELIDYGAVPVFAENLKTCFAVVSINSL